MSHIQDDIDFTDGAEHELTQQEDAYSRLRQAVQEDRGVSLCYDLFSKVAHKMLNDIKAAGDKSYRSQSSADRLEQEMLEGIYPSTVTQNVTFHIDGRCSQTLIAEAAAKIAETHKAFTGFIVQAKRENVRHYHALAAQDGPLARQFYRDIDSLVKEQQAKVPTQSEALAKETEDWMKHFVNKEIPNAFSEGVVAAKKALDKKEADSKERLSQTKYAVHNRTVAESLSKPYNRQHYHTSGEDLDYGVGPSKKPAPKKVIDLYPILNRTNFVNLLAGTKRQEASLQGSARIQREGKEACKVDSFMHTLRRKSCYEKSNIRIKRARRLGLILDFQELRNLDELGVARLVVHSHDAELDLVDGSALAMGHKFVPVPDYDDNILYEAINSFKRQMRWAWIFRHEPDKIKPKWYIPSGNEPDEKFHNHQLEAILQQFSKSMLAYKPKEIANNWPQYLEHRFQKLLNDESRLVILTDKNLGYAIVSVEWYTNQLSMHIKDTDKYTKIIDQTDENIIHTVQQRLNHIIETYYSEISSRELAWIAQEQTFQIMPFYVLAKIHKQPWSSRPITPSWCWPTFNLSKIIADELQPFVNESPIVLRDSKQLLQVLDKQTFNVQETKGRKLYLLSADVVALYPNIDTSRGVLAIYNELIDRSEYQGFYRHKRLQFICESLDVVLRSNYINVLGDTYQQINGTAMGTPLAPPYANLFLYHLEKSVIQKWTKKKHLLLYKRFIDDIFTIFYGTNKDLAKFQLEMNQLDPDIKLTWNSSQEKIDFLDITIFRHNNFGKSHKLETKLFQKALNQYLYLPFHSYHTKDMKKGFIKAEAIRYVRCCSLEKDYDLIINEFRNRLVRRGYNIKFVDRILSSIDYKDRAIYLQDKEVVTSTGLLFKVELNPAVDLQYLRQQLAEVTENMSYVFDATDRLKSHIKVCQKVPPRLHTRINSAKKRKII